MTSSNGNLFPSYWPFVRWIYRSPVNSPNKFQWRGALMFPMVCAWTNGSANNRDASDLRRSLWRHCNGSNVFYWYRLPTGSHILDKLTCHIWESYTLHTAVFVTSTYSTVVLALERYIKIVHPLWYVSCSTDKLVRRLILSAWIVGFATIAPFCFLSEVNAGRCCAVDLPYLWSVVIAVFDIGYIIAVPLLALMYCYIGIAHRLFRMKDSEIKSSDEQGQSARQRVAMRKSTKQDFRRANISRAYHGTLRTVLVVGAIYLLCWSVDEIAVIWRYIDASVLAKTDLWLATFVLLEMNCMLNPMSYFLSFREFRQRLWSRFWKRNPHGQTEAGSTAQASCATISGSVETQNVWKLYCITTSSI